MEYSVSEFARLGDVTVRTLRYYDEIGLLCPDRVSEAGYRFYGEGSLTRLREIVFLRELEFSLRDIRSILARPDYDKTAALEAQRTLLLLKRQRLDALLRLLDGAVKGEDALKQEKESAAAVNAAKARYAAEAEQRWGATPEYRESKSRHAGYDSDREAQIAAEADAIFAAFAAAMDREPGSPEARELVRRWQAHITEYHYPCSREILSSLGQMYAGDQRFAAYLDRFGDGNARFVSEAIAAYCAD